MSLSLVYRLNGTDPNACLSSLRKCSNPGPSGTASIPLSIGGTNAFTGKTNSWATSSLDNNKYADINGNVYRNDGSGWQQHSSSGWSNASGDTSWADRESQARSAGEDRWGAFSGLGGGRFGGSGGGLFAGRFSGGGFGGDRFGGGGFGGFGGRFGGGGFRR